MATTWSHFSTPIRQALTTEDLTAMNARADLDQEDPALIAEEWLTDNGFLE